MTTAIPPAERSRFLDHGGLRVMLFDFQGIVDQAEGLAAVAEATRFVASRAKPDGTGYTLTDVRRTRYDRVIVDAFKRFSIHNRPYVRAAAVVSDSTLHRTAISLIALVSRRKIAVFDTREAGLEYLRAEDAAARRSAAPRAGV